MSRHRVLIDIEFSVDDDSFKFAKLADDPSGVTDVSEAGVRDAVTEGVIETNWSGRGLSPVRSIVTTRELGTTGDYDPVSIPADPGVRARREP